MRVAQWMIVLILTGTYAIASAEFYRYVDEKGKVHFTDDLGNVPLEKRPKADEYEEPYDELTQEERVEEKEDETETSEGILEETGETQLKEAEEKTLVYATDCELNPKTDWDNFARIGKEVSGADLVILDGQYTANEYPHRIGWGHSAVEHVIELARETGLARVAITHHDPMRDDQHLTELERQVRKTIEEIEIFFARDGLAVDL